MDPADIDEGSVRALARMARLRPADEELPALTNDLRRILGWLAALEGAPGSAPGDRRFAPDDRRSAPGGAGLRADEPGPCLSRERVLAEAPDTDGEHFRVPSPFRSER